MKTLATGIMALWLGAAGGGAMAAEVWHGPNLTTADLPPAVRTTFLKQAKGARIQELRRENLNGRPVYSGEIVKNGRGANLRVSEQGKVVFHGKPEASGHGGERR
jgi:hypothetical protein